METLPKDIVRLLMVSYFDAATAVACLEVAKRFGASLLPGEDRLLRVNVLVARTRQRQREAIKAQLEITAIVDNTQPDFIDRLEVCWTCLNTVVDREKHVCKKLAQVCERCGLYKLRSCRLPLFAWHTGESMLEHCPLNVMDFPRRDFIIVYEHEAKREFARAAKKN